MPFGGLFGVAKYQGGLNARYTLELADAGTVVLSADAAFRSNANINNDLVVSKHGPLSPTSPARGVTPQLVEPGYGLLNLRADWKQIFGNPFDLATNATDKVYLSGGVVVAGMMVGTCAPPRMVGLELAYRFGEVFMPKN